MEGDIITMQDIFVYKQTGKDERGRLIGEIVSTGIKPKFMDKFERPNKKYANFERLEKKKTIISLLIILMIFDIAVVVLGHTGVNIYYSFLYGKVVPEIRIVCYFILLVLVILKGLMKRAGKQIFDNL